MAKMDKKIKKRWVAALRSGKYKQGKGALHNRQNEFCCLGVLCELAVEDGVIPSPRLSGDHYLYELKHGFPPKSVREWAGEVFGEDGDPDVPTTDEPYRTLSSMNDGGASFEEIAKVIQRRL